MTETMQIEIGQAQMFPETIYKDNKIVSIHFPDGTELVPYQLGLDLKGLVHITFPEGVYDGLILNGNQAGFGTFQADGSTVLGVFSSQQLQGPGAIIYATGSQVRCQFSSGIAEGFATAYEAENEVSFAGEFRCNQPEGLGCLVVGGYRGDQEDKELYFGYFQGGVPAGRGVQFVADGLKSLRYNRYEGYLTNGQRDGPGCIFLANGDMLLGQFSLNEKEGLFVYILEQGQLELRFYERDIVKETYASNLWIPRANDLKCMVVERMDLACYRKAVDYLKQLEAGKIPLIKDPLIEAVYKASRRLTIPPVVGLVDDMRVCQPLISEAIAETARQTTLCEANSAELVLEIEAIKSVIINNHDVLRFLFEFYRARDKATTRKRKYEKYDPLKEVYEAFAGEYLKIEEIKIEEKPDSKKQEATVSQEVMQQLRDADRRQSIDGNSDGDINLDQSQDDQEMEKAQSGNLVQSTVSQEQLQVVELQVQSKEINRQDIRERCDFCFKRLDDLPIGISATDNELLGIFCQNLDDQYVISRKQMEQFFTDLCHLTGKTRQLMDSMDYVQAVLNQLQRPADSFELYRQFNLNQPLGRFEYQFGLNQFVAVLLQVFDVFGYASFAQFLTSSVVVYAKKLIERMSKVFQRDAEALKRFYPNPENQAVFQPHAGDRDEQDSGMRSTQSKRTGKAPSGIANLPRILVRDFSFQLSEAEQLVIRTRGIDGRLLELYRRFEHQRGLVHHLAVNEKVESIITENYGVTTAQWIHVENLTVLQLLHKISELREVLGYPSFSDNPRIYIDALEPFMIKVLGFDMYCYKKQAYLAIPNKDEHPTNAHELAVAIMAQKVTIDKFFELVRDKKATQNVFMGILTCLLMKAPNLKVKIVEEEGEEENGSPSMKSVRSNISRREQEKEKEEDVVQATMDKICEAPDFDQSSLISLAGSILKKLHSSLM